MTILLQQYSQMVQKKRDGSDDDNPFCTALQTPVTEMVFEHGDRQVTAFQYHTLKKKSSCSFSFDLKNSLSSSFTSKNAIFI
jgi:hypothetical protein